MRHAAIVAGLVCLAGLLHVHAVGQDTPPQPPKKKANDPPPIRFSQTPTQVTGVSVNILGVAVSPDGKRIAIAGGSSDSSAGFISILDPDTKKETTLVKLSRVGASVEFSADGRKLAYADQGGTVGVVDSRSGKAAFTQKLGGTAGISLSADGKTAATVSDNKTIQVWDVAKGEERLKLKGVGPNSQLRAVALSPDGKRLAAAGAESNNPMFPQQGIAYLWDVATEKVVAKLDAGNQGTLLSLAFAADGATLYTGGTDGALRAWDTADGKARFAYESNFFAQAIAASPDGKTLATARNVVVLHDAGTGELVGQLEHGNSRPMAAAFTDGGKKIVTVGELGTVKLWDVSGKKLLSTLRVDPRPEPLPAPVTATAAPDGSLVALATEDRGVLLYDGVTGNLKATIRGHGEPVTCLAFSPDSKLLLTGSSDNTARLWDAAAGKELAVLKGHTNWVYAVAFAADGKTLATGSYDKSVRLWDMTGKSLATIEDAHRGSVRAVAFSPDGKTLATGGSDKLVKLWDVAKREARHTIKGHPAAVRAVAFGPSGMVVASASEDGTIRITGADDGKDRFNRKDHNDEVVALRFAGPRTLVSGGADGTFRIMDPTDGTVVASFNAHPGGVTGFAVTPGGLLSVGQDRIIKRWKSDSQPTVRLLAGHEGPLHAAQFSNDGKRLVSCGNWPEGGDKTLRIWDVEAGKQLLKIDHPGQASMAAFSPDGKFVASVSNDTSAYLWDAETGEQLRKYKGHTAGLNGVAFSADGKRLMTSGGDKTVRVWTVATGAEVMKFTGHTDMIRRCAFHPDGKHALSAGRDSFIRMWELDTGKEVRKFPSNGNWADCLGLSKDGKYVATGGKTVRVWETATGKLLHDCDGHRFGTTGADFSPDGKYLVSSGYDGVTKLWDVATGKELYRFRGHREYVFTVSFSPDGQWLATAGGGASVGDGQWTKGTDHAIRLWKMPTPQQMAEFTPEN